MLNINNKEQKRTHTKKMLKQTTQNVCTRDSIQSTLLITFKNKCIVKFGVHFYLFTESNANTIPTIIASCDKTARH